MALPFSSTLEDGTDDNIDAGDLCVASCSGMTSCDSATTSDRGIDPALAICASGDGWANATQALGANAPIVAADLAGGCSYKHELHASKRAHVPALRHDLQTRSNEAPDLVEFDLERAPFPEDVPVAFLCANASSRLFLSFWRSSCELLVCMCLHFSPYWHELVW